MFIDIAKIKIISGKGGDGKVSFHREKYVAAGGPDAAARLFFRWMTICPPCWISVTRKNMLRQTVKTAWASA